MAFLRRLVGSSIGRKWLMALTGLGLIGFLTVHLIGNLTIYGGSGAFNGYAEKLHSVGPILKVVELGLLAVALVHVAFALMLIVENLRARGTRYAGKKAEGGRSLGSRTMLVTGPYIAVFVVFHLLHFTFVEHSEPISAIVAARFLQAPWMAFYALSMLLVGLHVSHGLWSAFQTLGIENLRRGNLRRLSFVASLLVTLGFASLPVVVFAIADLLN